MIQLIQSGKVQIVVYEKLLDNMKNRELQPFPLPIRKINDKMVKEKILLLNEAFNHVVMSNFIPLDIDSCEGEQNFAVSEATDEILSTLNTDELYSDLLFLMITPCYNKEIGLSKYIIKSKESSGLKIGCEFSVICNCHKNEYYKNFVVVSNEYFESSKEKAFNALYEYRRNDKLLFYQSPTIVRGEHHNFLQKGDLPKNYSEISRNNKRVLSLLRYFGMNRIIFGRGFEDSTKTVGTILIDKVENNDTNSIVTGKIFLDKGCVNIVNLYFPKEIAVYIGDYFGKEITLDSITELKDRLVL